MAALAGVAIVAFVAAPSANARAFCDEAGGTTICQTNGSVAIKANPGTIAFPPYARNQIPWQPGSRPVLGGR